MLKNLYKYFCFILASAFGAGYSPKISGTVTSFLTLPFVFIVFYFFGGLGLIIVSVIVFLLGVIVSKEVLKYTEHDPSLITIDEVAGQFITFCFVGSWGFTNTFADCWIYLLGFALFRFFDILKPQPVRWADQKLENAFGVMFDDVLAGIYAGVLLAGILLAVEAFK